MPKENPTSIDIDYEQAEALFLDTRNAFSERILKTGKTFFNDRLPNLKSDDSRRKHPTYLSTSIYADTSDRNVLYLQYHGIGELHNSQSLWEGTNVGIFVENGEVTNIVAYKVKETVGKSGYDPDVIRPLFSFDWDTWRQYNVTDNKVKAKILLAAASTMHNYMNAEKDSIRNMNYALNLPVTQVRPS